MKVTKRKVKNREIPPKQIQLRREKKLLCTKLTWMSRDSPVWHTHCYNPTRPFPLLSPSGPSRSLSFARAVRPHACCYLTVCRLRDRTWGETGQETRTRETSNRVEGEEWFLFLCLLSLLDSKQCWDVTSAGDGSQTPAEWLWRCRAAVFSCEPD